MNQRVEIIVKTCEQCPFYKRGMISAIADAIAKDKRKTGVCEYHARAGVRHVFMPLFGVVHIAEPTHNPPDNCPLRSGETTIKLAGDA